MNRFKLLVPALCLVLLPAFAIFRTQDPKKEEKAAPGPTSARVQFALLTYTDMAGQAQTVGARNLHEVRLIMVPNVGPCLELLYVNGDYSLIRTSNFHFIRKAEGGPAEVMVSRVEPSGMAFPFVN